MIEFMFLTVQKGHDVDLSFSIESAESRALLKEQVDSLLKGGHALFLGSKEDSRLVKGYDDAKNTWLVTPKKVSKSKDRKKLDKVVASGNEKVVVVANTSGG